MLHTASVCAIPFPIFCSKAAQQALSKRYGKTVEAVFRTDSALLGGLKMACNGELLDGSIQTRLAKLQEELKG